nr:MAG TPA_asm: hypothetical protein [Caudoviricetes sp.]
MTAHSASCVRSFFIFGCKVRSMGLCNILTTFPT